jgi:hypothetical protein
MVAATCVSDHAQQVHRPPLAGSVGQNLGVDRGGLIQLAGAMLSRSPRGFSDRGRS